MASQFRNTILKRLISSVITLFLLVSMLFIMVRISPGNPAQKFISADLSPEIAEKISENFGLNEPLLTQYSRFVINLLNGEFGTSYNFRLPVLSVIWEFLSFTLVFALVSFLIQIFISYRLAIFVVQNKNEKIEKLISNLLLVFYSTPAFVIGVLLIYLFAVNINLFPISGLTSLDYESKDLFGKFLDNLYHLILPLITISIAGIALFYRYLKDNLENVYHQTFILQLKANGISELSILKKHIIPNAVGPLISAAGIEFGILLGGTLITEVIFSLPGMGRLAIDSILTRDYPLIIGCTFTAGFLMILANFLADLIKYRIDKRLLRSNVF